jgi:pimeloyl-ACP methyl ester carboxylesterase
MERPGRRVADAARDAAAVADALGVERFAVVGRSGGAPHAPACAALLPGRVRAASALVTVAPPDAEGLDWFAGMTPFNVREYGLATRSPDLLDADLAARAAAIRKDPQRLVEDLRAEVSDHDLPIVDDPGVRTALPRNYRAALDRSHHGWTDDCLAFTRPWGFGVSAVTVPVLFRHGLDDAFPPPSHTRWPAGRITGADLVLEPDAGHFAAQYALPHVLEWLQDRGEDQGTGGT